MSTVNVSEAFADVLLAASVDLTYMVCDPSDSAVVTVQVNASLASLKLPSSAVQLVQLPLVESI